MSARYISVAETAKLVREALKRQFPGQKFSVRSKSYSGGGSVTAYWTDGPRAEEVNKVLHRFEGASFDGMIDLKTTHSSVLSNDDGTVEEVRFGADYVFGNRAHSEESQEELIRFFEKDTGEKFESSRHYPYRPYLTEKGEVVLSRDPHVGEWGSTILAGLFNYTSYYKGETK